MGSSAFGFTKNTLRSQKAKPLKDERIFKEADALFSIGFTIYK
jgi:hypothetical protein